MIYRKVFCTLKHHNLTFERKHYLLQLFRLLIIESFSYRNVILKTISQLK